jgi:hypothetical protein
MIDHSTIVAANAALHFLHYDQKLKRTWIFRVTTTGAALNRNTYMAHIEMH